MKLIPDFVDERGSIIDLVVGEQVDGVTIIESKEGTVRANHYHKFTTQWTYVIQGKLDYYSKNMKDGKTTLCRLSKGMMICSEPMVAHAIKSVTYTKILIVTKGPRSGKNYESDTFRLEEHLV